MVVCVCVCCANDCNKHVQCGGSKSPSIFMVVLALLRHQWTAQGELPVAAGQLAVASAKLS
jgi:hypothetical protein